MAIANKNDLSHIVRTTQQWTTSYDSYECIPEGVLCVEFTPDGHVKAKIGNGHDIFSKLPYIDGADLTNYYTKSETAKCVEEIIKANRFIRIKGILQNKDQLPSHAECGDLYFVISQNQSSSNKYDEYVYSPSNTWENLGSIPIDIDLSEYAKIVYVDEKIDEVNERIDDIEQHGTHTHANKDILDLITAAFTAEEKDKLSTLYNYDDTELRELITQASHTHSNKDILDAISAPFTKEDKSKLDQLNPYDDSILKEKIQALERLAHEHSNKRILDRTTASFTTEYERKIRWIRLYTGCTGMEEGIAGLVPAAQAGEEDYVLSGSGEWVPQTGGGGTYELPIATTSTLGGIKVGDGLEIDANGKLSVTGGGGGGDTVTEGGGISITTDAQTGDKIIAVNAGTGLTIDPVTGELNVTGGGGGGDTIAEGGGISITTDPQTGDKVISVDVGDNLEIDPQTGELNVTGVDYEAGQGIHIGSQYNLLEFIKNSGNYDQVIVTDIIPSFSTKIKMDIKFGAAIARNYRPFVGCGYTGTDHNKFQYLVSLDNASPSTCNIAFYNKFNWTEYNTGSNFIENPYGIDYYGTNPVRQILTMCGSNGSWGNTTRNFSNEIMNDFVEPYIPMAIFGTNRITTPAAFIDNELWVYSVKIYDDNAETTLLYDLRPAERVSDGEAGLYDVINHKFYGNAGGGSFVKGTVIPSDDRIINAKIGNGLQFDSNNAIEVNTGDGLQINQDGELEIDPSIIPEVTEYEAGEAIEIAEVTHEDEFRVQNQEYFFDTRGLTCGLNARVWTTVNDGDILAAMCIHNNGGNQVPLFVGLTEDSVKVSQNYNSTILGPNGSFDYRGKTWYFTADYALSGTDGQDTQGHIQTLPTTYSFNSTPSNFVPAAKDLIDLAVLLSDLEYPVISVKYNKGLTVNQDNELEVNIGTGLEFDQVTGAINVTGGSGGGDTVEAGDGIDITTDSQTGNKVISIDTGNGLQINQDGELEIDPSIIPEVTEYEAGTAISIEDAEHGGVTFDAWDSGTGWENVCYQNSTGNAVVTYTYEAHSPISNSYTLPAGATHIRAIAYDQNDTMLWTSFSWIDANNYHFASTSPEDGHYNDWFDIPEGAVKVNFGVRHSKLNTSQSMNLNDIKSVDITIQTISEIEVDVWTGVTGWTNGDYYSGTSDTFTRDWYYTYHYDPTAYIPVPEGALKIRVIGISNENDSHFEGGGANIFDSNHHHIGWLPCCTATGEWVDIPEGTVYVQPEVKWSNGNTRTISAADIKSVTLAWKLPALEINQAINVKYGDGLTVNQNNELEVNIGTGLEIDPQTGAINVTGGGSGGGNSGNYIEGEAIEFEEGASRLPTGYTELENISNVSASYIDTGYIPNTDTQLSIIANIHRGTTSWQTLFGARDAVNPGGTEYAFFVRLNDNYNFYPRITGDQYTYMPNQTYDEKIRIDINNTTATVTRQDGSSYSYTQTGSLSNLSTTLAIFALHNQTGYVDNGIIDLYSFKIYENNTIVKDFVPCKRNSDDAIGLIDIINNVFYTNLGTGTFTAGRILTNTSINVKYGTGLSVDPVTNELFVDGQLPEGTIIKKLTYTGNGASTNNIQFDKKPLAILSLNGSSGQNYGSLIPTFIDSPYLHGVFGGSTNSGTTFRSSMSYDDSTNTLSLTNTSDEGLAFNIANKPYVMYYLTKGHTGSGTSVNNEVSVIKTITYTGTGTATNNIQFPETPDMLLSIYGPTSDGFIASSSVPITSTSIAGIYEYGSASRYGGVVSCGMSFNDSTNILTLSGGVDDGARFNISGATYIVTYSVNEVIASQTAYAAGEAISIETIGGLQLTNYSNDDFVDSITRMQAGSIVKAADKSSFTLTATYDDCYTQGSSGQSNGSYPYNVKASTKYRFAWDSANPDKYGIVYVFENGQYGDMMHSANQHDASYIEFTTTAQTSYIQTRFGVDYAGNSITYSNVRLYEVIEDEDQYDEISVKYNKGLTVNQNNELEVNIGTGLAFDPQTGAINVTGGGGGSGDTVTEGAGIEITTDQQTGNKVIAVNAGTGLQVDQTTNELEIDDSVLTEDDELNLVFVPDDYQPS